MTLTTTQVDPMLLPDSRPAGSRVRSTIFHALLAAVLWVLPVLVMFVPAVFISSGLRNGWKGMFGSITGAAALLSLVLVNATAAQRFTYASQIALLVAEIGIGAIMATLLIRRGQSSGSVLLGGVAGSAVGFVAIELIGRASSGKSMFAEVVRAFRANAATMLETWRSRGTPEHMLAAMKQASETVAGSFVPAVLIIGMIISFALSLMLIPRLRIAAVGGAMSESLRFRALQLPDWLLLAFVAGGLSPLAGGTAQTIGLNMLAVVVFLYLLQGVAILRSVLVKLQLGFFGMAMTFALLLLLTQFFIAPIALFLAGLFDPFFDFRKLHRKEENNESDSD